MCQAGSGIVIPELRSAEGFRDWLLTLTAEERRQAFMDAEAGPMPEGVYTGVWSEIWMVNHWTCCALTFAISNPFETQLYAPVSESDSWLMSGFMLSDRPNYEDFEISIVNKAIMAFIFDRWIGKVRHSTTPIYYSAPVLCMIRMQTKKSILFEFNTSLCLVHFAQEFDGKGNLQNVLRSDAGFRPKDLAGTLELENGYIDEKKSWMALYGNETKYNFILDEFREIQPGFLFGITFIVPAKKGDPSFFECGLVRLGEYHNQWLS